MVDKNCIDCWDKITDAKPGEPVTLCSEECKRAEPSNTPLEVPETQELIY